MPAIAPRMAAANAFHREPASARCAVFANGFLRVLRTTRRIAATTKRSEQKSFRGRQRPAIERHQADQNVLRRVHFVCVSPVVSLDFNNPARRSVVRKSFSTWAKA